MNSVGAKVPPTPPAPKVTVVAIIFRYSSTTSSTTAIQGLSVQLCAHGKSMTEVKSPASRLFIVA